VEGLPHPPATAKIPLASTTTRCGSPTSTCSSHEKRRLLGRVVEDHLSATPERINAPLRVTIEHEAPIALGYAG